jgi:hypothetical protein
MVDRERAASSLSSVALQSQSKAELPVAPRRLDSSSSCSYWSTARRGPSQEEITTTVPSMVLMRRESSTRPTESAKTHYENYSGAITASNTTLVLAQEEKEEEGEEDYDAWTLHGSPPAVTQSDEGRQLWNTTTSVLHDSGSVTVEHVDMSESLEMDDITTAWKTSSYSSGNGNGILGYSSWSSSSGRDGDYCDEDY